MNERGAICWRNVVDVCAVFLSLSFSSAEMKALLEAQVWPMRHPRSSNDAEQRLS